MKCIKCKKILDIKNKYCSNCGKEVLPIWKEVSKEEFCESIGLNKYIRTELTKNSGYAFGSDDYTIIDIKNDNGEIIGHIYSGYEESCTVYLGNKIKYGKPTSLKYYEQFAPKEVINYHFKQHHKEYFAWAMLAIHLQMIGAELYLMDL